jgi:hypothetical protein
MGRNFGKWKYKKAIKLIQGGKQIINVGMWVRKRKVQRCREQMEAC